MAYFPMFVQLKEEKCLVIGGGKIALRKIEVLKDFEADITVIAPEMITQIRQIDQICRIFRNVYGEKILMRQIFVIAATDDQKQIMRSARSADERRFLSMRSIRKKIAALFFHPM